MIQSTHRFLWKPFPSVGGSQTEGNDESNTVCVCMAQSYWKHSWKALTGCWGFQLLPFTSFWCFDKVFRTTWNKLSAITLCSIVAMGQKLQIFRIEHDAWRWSSNVVFLFVYFNFPKLCAWNTIIIPIAAHLSIDRKQKLAAVFRYLHHKLSSLVIHNSHCLRLI